MSDLDALPFASEVSISEARREDKKQEVPEVIWKHPAVGEATLLESITCVLSSFFLLAL